MLDADREKLQDKLIDLMVMRSSGYDGAPYVREDGTFGLYCGDVKGGLHSAYHLIDALKTGGLFAGRQAPGTELDDAISGLYIGHDMQPFKEVRLYWNETGQMQVDIKTDKPLEAVLAALDIGIQEAKTEVRQRFNEKASWEDDKLRDHRRDNTPSLFGPAVDAAFFNAYMAVRFEKELSLPGVTFTETMPDAIEAAAVRDGRLRHELRFGGVVNSPVHPFDFVRDLENVFTGKMAVFFYQHKLGIDDIELRISGSNARLTADILDNDSAGARAALERIKPAVNLETVKEIIAQIDSRDSGTKTAQSLTAGTEAKMTALKPLKFRAHKP